MINPNQKKIHSLSEARQKIEAYCAYQERSHKQVSEKLRAYGLIPEAVDELLGELIQNNFLNEGRFAMSFVSGKVNIKKWGKHKIEMHLKQHQVSGPNIKKALKSIDAQVYQSNLYQLAESKADSINGSPTQKKGKLYQYLYNRGYEKDMIYPCVEEVLS